MPFVLLFNIATSVELFQANLSRETIRCLAGVQFHMKRVDTRAIFQDIHYQEPALFFGPAITGLILQKHKDFIQSSANLTRTLKVLMPLQ